MLFNAIFTKKTVCFDKTARSKTAVFLKLSQILNKTCPHIETEDLFNAYWERENLGSTTIGHGIMIPHIRNDHVQKITGCAIKLLHPVDFGANDKQPIFLILGLLVPSSHIDEHLRILSEITTLFSLAEYRQACREATNSSSLYTLLTQNTYSHCITS